MTIRQLLPSIALLPTLLSGCADTNPPEPITSHVETITTPVTDTARAAFCSALDDVIKQVYAYGRGKPAEIDQTMATLADHAVNLGEPDLIDTIVAAYFAAGLEILAAHCGDHGHPIPLEPIRFDTRELSVDEINGGGHVRSSTPAAAS